MPLAPGERQLQWIASGRSSRELAPQPATKRASRVSWWIAAACLAVGLVFGGAATLVRPAAVVPGVPRTALSIVPPPGVRAGATFALPPDGRHFAFVGSSGEGQPVLWLRALDDTTARPLAGTEDASYPFWSPQSDVIGFFASGKLKTIAIGGGVPRTLADVANGRGAAWGVDGTIVFGGQTNPLFRVSDRGGPVTAATVFSPMSGITGHRWPTFVGPRQFVYTAQAGAADAGIFLASLDSTEAKKLNGIYSNTLFSDGRLLFVLNEMLVEQTLDLTAGALTGTPIEILGPVSYTTGLGYAPISMAANRTIAYTERSAAGAPSELIWLDRQGKRLSSLGADVGLGRDMTYNERLSPDGRTVVLSAFRMATADIWLIDLPRLVATRVTFSDANDQPAIFSPNGDEIIFGPNRAGPFNLYRKRVNGSSEETRFLEAATSQYPEDWSHDGSTILLLNNDPKTGNDIWTVGSDGTKPSPLLATAVIDTGTGGVQTRHYEVTADGQRFLANVAAASPVPPTIVSNWTSAAEAPASR